MTDWLKEKKNSSSRRRKRTFCYQYWQKRRRFFFFSLMSVGAEEKQLFCMTSNWLTMMIGKWTKHWNAIGLYSLTNISSYHAREKATTITRRSKTCSIIFLERKKKSPTKEGSACHQPHLTSKESHLRCEIKKNKCNVDAYLFTIFICATRRSSVITCTYYAEKKYFLIRIDYWLKKRRKEIIRSLHSLSTDVWRLNGMRFSMKYMLSKYSSYSENNKANKHDRVRKGFRAK